MIDYVRGEVHRVAATHVVVDVAGVGYRVEATPGTVADLRVGQIREVPTSLVVREDAWTLYGFADCDERDVFELVQTVSGVGPRTAQAIVGTLTADGLRRAVHGQDTTALMAVPGIGRKGAQRILLELTDRLGPGTDAAPSAVPTGPTAAPPWRASVVSGLTGLGWSTREAEAAASAVEPRAPELTGPAGEPDVAALLRAALKELNRP